MFGSGSVANLLKGRVFGLTSRLMLWIVLKKKGLGFGVGEILRELERVILLVGDMGVMNVMVGRDLFYAHVK